MNRRRIPNIRPPIKPKKRQQLPSLKPPPPPPKPFKSPTNLQRPTIPKVSSWQAPEPSSPSPPPPKPAWQQPRNHHHFLKRRQEKQKQFQQQQQKQRRQTELQRHNKPISSLWHKKKFDSDPETSFNQNQKKKQKRKNRKSKSKSKTKKKKKKNLPKSSSSSSSSSSSTSRKRKHQHYISALSEKKIHSPSPPHPPPQPRKKKKRRKLIPRDESPLPSFFPADLSTPPAQYFGLDFLDEKIEIPKIIKISQKDWPPSPPGCDFEDLSDEAYYKRHYRASVRETKFYERLSEWKRCLRSRRGLKVFDKPRGPWQFQLNKNEEQCIVPEDVRNKIRFNYISLNRPWKKPERLIKVIGRVRQPEPYGSRSFGGKKLYD